MIRLQTPLPDRYREASKEDLTDWIKKARTTLGDRVLVLGHHYQQDEVMRWADASGDSFGLSRIAAERSDAEFVIFCGVHFMAESADILTKSHQKVILPDLNAGCSMADMADIEQVEQAWDELSQIVDTDRLMPVTYMNSSAALKAFVGEHKGAVCTSSNAQAILDWAIGPKGKGVDVANDVDRDLSDLSNSQASRLADKVLFFPDQHLGRNTGYILGYESTDMAVWNPRHSSGGLSAETIKESTILLWKGHCSVHQRFLPEHVEAFRQLYPQGLVLVHPECSHEVVELADKVGSTDYIIKAVAQAPKGTVIGIATEIHLVNRLASQYQDKKIICLDPVVCPCSTMSRIDSPHLAWVLEGLVEGEVRNQISVDQDTSKWARVALERMLSIV